MQASRRLRPWLYVVEQTSLTIPRFRSSEPKESLYQQLLDANVNHRVTNGSNGFEPRRLKRRHLRSLVAADEKFVRRNKQLNRGRDKSYQCKHPCREWPNDSLRLPNTRTD